MLQVFPKPSFLNIKVRALRSSEQHSQEIRSDGLAASCLQPLRTVSSQRLFDVEFAWHFATAPVIAMRSKSSVVRARSFDVSMSRCRTSARPLCHHLAVTYTCLEHSEHFIRLHTGVPLKGGPAEDRKSYIFESGRPREPGKPCQKVGDEAQGFPGLPGPPRSTKSKISVLNLPPPLVPPPCAGI